MPKFSQLWTHPEINPINKKARSIPFLNPFTDRYGRVFFFSWFGFMIAFWSWYAFPPLLSDVIAADIHMTSAQVANSNIIALVATLLVRLISGPACDRYGPRITFATLLLLGALPTFLSGTVTSPTGLYVLRFFIGILGGSFVPCQVWTTAFFDKEVVGTANALTGGLGNLGGGVTYFVMPAVYNGLVSDGLKGHVAWRVAFVVPGVMILAVASCLLLLCEDGPEGKWMARGRVEEAEGIVRVSSVRGVDAGGRITDGPLPLASSSDEEKTEGGLIRGTSDADKDLEKKTEDQDNNALTKTDTATGEIITPQPKSASFHNMLAIMTSPQTLTPALCYFSTFGAELSINSILGSYYLKHYPSLTLQDAGNWAAMFGLLNGVARPLGGYLSDLAYRRFSPPPSTAWTDSVDAESSSHPPDIRGVWAKKAVLHTYSLLTALFLILIGTLNARNSQATTLALVALLALVLEGANGAVFGLVPHIHPHANGVVSGVTGAAGNLGGIIFGVVFRCFGTGVGGYGKSFWVIGAIVAGLNLGVCWIRPVAKTKR